MIDIIGYENLYKIDKTGKIWSCPKNSKYLSFHKGMFLKKTIDRGYEYVTLHKNSKQKKIAVHRLVAQHFIPNLHNKPHINHINGVKNDNRFENLEWCTPKENCQHSWDNSLSCFTDKMREVSVFKMIKWNNTFEGKKHMSENGKSRRKLSKQQVLTIIEKSSKGQSAYSLSKEYPVSKQTILKIIRKETYKEFLDV